MEIQISPDLLKRFRSLKRRDKSLSAKIEKQLALFQQNPHYPSLRNHQLVGSQQQVWSISITGSVRMLYAILEDEIFYFFDLGTHDQVYRRS
ncbi:type II toxin-antitoxin system mRNA interferase toxin, RelE/StbE family [Candidatus Collierbacteria bacterium]|nr:type II toxin-antitoxin system mRNA interferase toxin, RelE/StbE family [Candidatus Collierbacteria bacterium]